MIGVYDSGFGGLTVLRALRARLPEADFLYFGDSGRAPYGGRGVEDILDFAEQSVELLLAQGCAVVVVACNTVSCVALRHLQARYNTAHVRVLGVTIPAAELVVSLGFGKIGVLATQRTVSSGTYPAEIRKLSPHIEVVQRAAPLLAAIVEEGWEDSVIADEACRRYLAALGGCEVVLLGCTHYPLLRRALAQFPGPVIDPSAHVADRLADWLARHPTFVREGCGALRVMCSGDGVAFATHGARFLGNVLPEVSVVGERGGKLLTGLAASATGQVVR